jgi:hypothetical protein
MSSAPENPNLEDDTGHSGVELHEQSYDEFGNSLEETGILTGRRSIPSGHRQQEDGWFGRWCACCEKPARNSRNRRVETSWASIFAVVNFLLVIVLAGAAGVMYRQLSRQIESLDNNLIIIRDDFAARTNAITHNVTALREAELSYEDSTNRVLRSYGKSLSDIARTLEDHQSQLTRLSNGTSNADVLDKLMETRAEVTARLEREHGEVFALVEQSRRNVSLQLEQNSAQMSTTKQHVDSALNQTVSYMQAVVGTASTDIRTVQKNVTSEIALMTNTVHTIVLNLGDKVRDAEVTIHEEVEAVRQNIAQYVAVTDKQFAAENDFVKYQLAGTYM